MSNVHFLSHASLDQLITMKVIAALALAASSAQAFAPSSKFAVRSSKTTSISMADYDLDFGKNNDYVPAPIGDGGQGTFGAVSPSNWRVPGTSPIGESSYSGAFDGGDEPWFAEAVSTVSLDLEKADETLKAFTKDAAMFKIEAFAETSPYKFTTKEAAMEELIGALGYSKFLECTAAQLGKTWGKLHPAPGDK